MQALRLPFADFDYAGDRQTIQFWLDEDGWRCTLADYVCGKQEDPRRPRGFGVVRDLSIPADNHRDFHPTASGKPRWRTTTLCCAPRAPRRPSA
ncbi:hypothetical protein [Novosphingobium sp. ST904]|uniref:hypothetical protein n=1 Tax=Novosphingobium sp. ST904 TaxID=1684385 RepID=UPI001E4BE596|nr:hypothetical protein [Novosphingobium sp. ST904]